MNKRRGHRTTSSSERSGPNPGGSHVSSRFPLPTAIVFPAAKLEPARHADPLPSHRSRPRRSPSARRDARTLRPAGARRLIPATPSTRKPRRRIPLPHPPTRPTRPSSSNIRSSNTHNSSTRRSSPPRNSSLTISNTRRNTRNNSSRIRISSSSTLRNTSSNSPIRISSSTRSPTPSKPSPR